MEIKEEQKKRFLARIDDPDKNWKFSPGDLKERALWDDYQHVFEHTINETATKDCPWYVVPADQKWFARYVVSEAILDALKRIDPQYPEMQDEARAELADCRRKLMEEEG